MVLSAFFVEPNRSARCLMGNHFALAMSGSLYRKQFLPISPAEAWDFFSSPANLQTITPPALDFRITNQPGSKAYPGQIITYRIRPLWGIDMEWVTEITQLVEGQYFIDTQLKGPYQFWHHEHRFEAAEGGVVMEDKLYYGLPLGILGEWARRLFIDSRVEAIFAYREKVLANRFGR